MERRVREAFLPLLECLHIARHFRTAPIAKESSMAEKNSDLSSEELTTTEKITTTRKSFRVPVNDPFTLTVKIGDESFGAFDVVEGGVGVFQSRRNLFSIGEEIDNITLLFRGEPLAMQGRVVHISRDEDNTFRYGVQFTKLDPETEDKLVSFVSRTREDYFQE
ncbi:PilZ domain-containing protein [Oceanidesulfovibrio marinus]|uniref:PilZ domain-containing protein n=1 Tax=Oceanidesulfovibrio marinus TaxID=370038 RepID=A0ABX6NE93_9BACT|nr:PilZ domain-containing protein [Oceanidesulfovibrio marinus]